MTPDQITQLRKLLREIVQYYTKRDGQSNAPFSVKLRLEEALALLPCSTCNGTGKQEYTASVWRDDELPMSRDCPDCK